MRFLLILLCLACASCEKSAVKEKSLRLVYLSEANSLDPRYGYEIPANHTVKMLYEGLIRLSADHELIPGAAEEYFVTSDGKTFTFKIRPAKWSNGAHLTAHDFEYAWKSVIDPKIPTQGTADFYPIKNVEAIVKGELPVEEAGVKALDERTLLVELEYPAPYFLELTATSAYSPVYSKALEQDPAAEVYSVTNGPFRLKKRLEHHETILEKNPYYWDAEAVQLERIEISIVEDASTQLALFEKGECDWLGKPFAKLPLDAVPCLREKGALNHFPERAIYWYFINTERFPYTHPKVRRALALSINREEIVTHVLKEGEEKARGVNRGSRLFEDASIAEARTLFDEALSELGLNRKTFPPLRLSYCNIETNHRIASVVQQQWQNALSIEVKLDPQEWTAYYDNLTTGNFEIGGLSWHARISDPIYNLQLFKYADDRLNISNWEDRAFQTTLKEAQEESDPLKRLALLEKAETILMDEMPVIPIYFLTISYAKNPQLKGVCLSELNEIDFSRASK
ncbi:MAG: peptide ABC transporter substrate-binding protein [Chlamydiales bacterium]|nr:peptide ABC transporter substrate-binding protein [Chlamydiales bacterium]